METKQLKRLPVGIQTFDKLIQGGYLYVDKTKYIHKMVNVSNYIFLSRPRRFGKSLLVSTLQSYFEGRKELFEGLAIDRLEKEWNRYPVLHLSFGGQNYAESTDLDEVLEEGQNGFEYTSAEEFLDAIDHVMHDPKWREDASKRSEEIAAAFDKKNFGDAIENIYESVL